jgi:hypothetical protein
MGDGCCHQAYERLVSVFPFLSRRENDAPPRLTLKVPKRSISRPPEEKSVQRTFSSDDLQDTAAHRVQSSASKFARSHSGEAINLTEYRGDPLSPRARRNSFNSDALLDSPRHRVQAAASDLIHRRSLNALEDKKKTRIGAEMKGFSPSIPRLHDRFPVKPEACFEFESSGAFSDDEDEVTSSRHRRSKGILSSVGTAVWQFFARPFVTFSRSPRLKVVRGRLRSSSRDNQRTAFSESDSSTPEFIKEDGDTDTSETLPSCPTTLSKKPEDFPNTHNLLVGCGAFDLKPDSNMSSEDARRLREKSVLDPARLLGLQICLLGDYDNPDEGGSSEAKMSDLSPEADSVDESIQPMAERLRVVVAYERKHCPGHMKKLFLYLLVKKDGTFEWSELSRCKGKSGYRFTALRRVCV